MVGTVLKTPMQNNIVVSYELVTFRYQSVLLSRVFPNMFSLYVIKQLLSKNGQAKSKEFTEKNHENNKERITEETQNLYRSL